MSRKLGYARVSTADQNLALQMDSLVGYGIEERDIFKEKMTGSKKDRPELDRLLSYVEPGDVIVVWKLDRIGRSMRHLIELMDFFRENDIQFVSLKENIDTTTATGKLVFAIMAALSEFERDMIIERTKAGLSSARARGRNGGRPPKDPDKVKLALSMYDSRKFTIGQITEATGIKKATLYKYLKTRRIDTKINTINYGGKNQ